MAPRLPLCRHFEGVRLLLRTCRSAPSLAPALPMSFGQEAFLGEPSSCRAHQTYPRVMGR